MNATWGSMVGIPFRSVPLISSGIGSSMWPMTVLRIAAAMPVDCVDCQNRDSGSS